MLLILPDEGVTAEELLSDSETLDFLLNHRRWTNKKSLTVNQCIPKFDVVSDIDFRTILGSLGVTDVLDSEKADFTPITDDPEVYLHQAKHAARVLIDEEGCRAVAFTVMVNQAKSMPPEEKVDFVLNRPFLFAILGQDDQLLFVEVVNQP